MNYTPCLRGHLSPRGPNRQCKECKRLQDIVRNEKQREARRARGLIKPGPRPGTKRRSNSGGRRADLSVCLLARQFAVTKRARGLKEFHEERNERRAEIA